MKLVTLTGFHGRDIAINPTELNSLDTLKDGGTLIRFKNGEEVFAKECVEKIQTLIFRAVDLSR